MHTLDLTRIRHHITYLLSNMDSFLSRFQFRHFCVKHVTSGYTKQSVTSFMRDFTDVVYSEIFSLTIGGNCEMLEPNLFA